MTSSPSSSSRALRIGALAATAALLACAHTRSPRTRATLRPGGPIALFPPANLSGALAPVQDLASSVDAAMRKQGIELLSGAPTDAFLAAHRIRYTGGLTAEAAVQARDDLGAAAVLITTVTAFQEAPPRLGLELRLVSTGSDPQVLWAGGAARAGDESPGIFGLGVVVEMKTLMERVSSDLASSLAAWQRGEAGDANGCGGSRRFSPRVSFRAPSLDPKATYSIAVLPFVNETSRRGAGDVVPLQFLRQLLAARRFRAIEPGVIREELLRFRIVMENGISLDTARIVLELLQADLVLTGTVRTYRDPTSAAAAPAVQFTALLLDRRNTELLWESTSDGQGDDGVFLFDAGKVSTAGMLTCRMAGSVVQALLDERSARPARALSP